MSARVWLMGVLVLALGAHAQQEERPWSPDAALAARLEALGPADPRAYLRLGEEVADDATTEGQRALARRLLVLAYELDRRAGGGARVSASACLALAALEATPRDQRWLRAVAVAVDPRYDASDWQVDARPEVSARAALDAASALGLARAGESRAAQRLLDQPEVRAILKRYERALGLTGSTGALYRLDRAIAEWPCPECANRRSVSRNEPGGVVIRLCPHCGGDPGPRLSYAEWIAQLRFESALLRGLHRSWAADLAVDQSAPLRDPDPSALAEVFEVDASRAWWRGGAWVGSDGAGSR